MKKILVTGALGQIGSELVLALGKKYGYSNVIASDCRSMLKCLQGTMIFEHIDCLYVQRLENVVKKHDINTIYHLAAILSANAEQNPELAWKVNIDGLRNVLNVAQEYNCSVFVPSSMAVFDALSAVFTSGSIHKSVPQDVILRPQSIYGVTKAVGETLCNYYVDKLGVDVRGVRYPGIVSNVALPGGGTTDYAVQIFYDAVEKGQHTCYLDPDTRLEMMYMPDALRAAMNLMGTDLTKLVHRNAFNVSAMSFTPEEVTSEIRKHIPSFKVSYKVDSVRQGIADSWPKKIDDFVARKEWGWCPEYGLAKMTEDMISVLKKRLIKGSKKTS